MVEVTLGLGTTLTTTGDGSRTGSGERLSTKLATSTNATAARTAATASGREECMRATMPVVHDPPIRHT